MSHRPYPNRDRARRRAVRKTYDRAMTELAAGRLYDSAVIRFGTLTITAAVVTDGELLPPEQARCWDDYKHGLWQAERERMSA